jgi:hypothetical protein
MVSLLVNVVNHSFSHTGHLLAFLQELGELVEAVRVAEEEIVQADLGMIDRHELTKYKTNRHGSNVSDRVKFESNLVVEVFIVEKAFHLGRILLDHIPLLLVLLDVFDADLGVRSIRGDKFGGPHDCDTL